jgi:hypothetical protein
MDRWLTAVERDGRDLPVADKIVADKPSDLTDRCYDGSGQQLTGSLCGEAVVPVYGTPRMVAGDAITTDTNKCRLRPLSRSDYPPLLTDAQFAELQQVFPSGVCDFGQPGVGQQPTVAWQTYQDATGQVVYGGQPLGPPPVSQPLR